MKYVLTAHANLHPIALQDEIPYSCEVVIDSFRDKSKSLSVIEAGGDAIC